MNESDKRPWTVVLGCAVSLALAVWDTVSSVSDEEIVESHGLLALLVALSVIPLIFTLAALFRRNWGRITLAAITGLGIVSVPVFTHFWPDLAGPVDAETVLYAIAEVAVIVLLFVPASNEWYRKSGPVAGVTMQP